MNKSINMSSQLISDKLLVKRRQYVSEPFLDSWGVFFNTSKGGKPRHPVFHAYFHRKVKEGKTKSQALVCVMRRAVNIVYGMMKNQTAYVPYEDQD